MINAALYVVVGLFGLKILWNLGVPIVLLRRSMSGAGRASMSFAPAVELSLVALGTGISFFTTTSGLGGPKEVAIGGTAICAASYGMMFLVGYVAASALSLMKKRNKRSRPSDDQW